MDNNGLSLCQIRVLTDSAVYIVGCNGAKTGNPEKTSNRIDLECRKDMRFRNVDISYYDQYPVDFLSPRFKDLLEIVIYLFSANVKINRDFPQPQYFTAEGRSYRFNVNVRDYYFWKQQDIKILLEELLYFMTGDDYRFSFYKMQTGATDKGPGWIPKSEEHQITLFSGGPDSTAGLIELTETTSSKVILVSHQAGLPETAITQNRLFERISGLYPEQCSHFRFQCGFPGINYDDKKNATRILLYSTAAFILAGYYNQDYLSIYENGISSFQFENVYSPAKYSSGRQTHPKTLGLIALLFSRISEKEFTIKQPFLFKTRAGVIDVLNKYNKQDLFQDTISCCNLKERDLGKSHCGKCLPCVDRILAALASSDQKLRGSGTLQELFPRIISGRIQLKVNFSHLAGLCRNACTPGHK